MKNIDLSLSDFPVDELPDSRLPLQMLLNTFAKSAIRGIKHEDEDDWKSMQTTSFVDRFSLFQIRDMSSLFIDLIHAASGRWVNWCPSATGEVWTVLS